MIVDNPNNALLSITRNSPKTVALLPRTNYVVKLNSMSCIVVSKLSIFTKIKKLVTSRIGNYHIKILKYAVFS